MVRTFVVSFENVFGASAFTRIYTSVVDGSVVRKVLSLGGGIDGASPSEFILVPERIRSDAIGRSRGFE